ncbi:5163_t:CDS:2 [Gigaspora rosea]|nr:5163_t:CDS:2 [Gigaspora rosea]
MYSSKSINTRKITDALRSNSISKIAEDEISQRIESEPIDPSNHHSTIDYNCGEGNASITSRD